MTSWFPDVVPSRRDPPGVINVRVAELRKPRRPGGPHHDLAAWLAASPMHVYCGRRVHHVPATFDSVFRNDTPRGSDLRAFEERFRGKLANDPTLIEQTVGLLGKTLGCWCKPKECHCDILLKIAEEYSNICPPGGFGAGGAAGDATGTADDDVWGIDCDEETWDEMGDFMVSGPKSGGAPPRNNRGAAGNARGGGGQRRRVDGKEPVYSARHVRRKTKE